MVGTEQREGEIGGGHCRIPFNYSRFRGHLLSWANNQVLDLLVFAQPGDTAFAADAALLEAAGRGVGRGGRAVDLYCAAADAMRDSQSGWQVGGVDAAAQPVLGVVGDGHRLVDVAVALHGDNWTQPFLLGAPVGVVLLTPPGPLPYVPPV